MRAGPAPFRRPPSVSRIAPDARGEASARSSRISATLPGTVSVAPCPAASSRTSHPAPRAFAATGAYAGVVGAAPALLREELLRDPVPAGSQHRCQLAGVVGDDPGHVCTGADHSGGRRGIRQPVGLPDAAGAVGDSGAGPATPSVGPSPRRTAARPKVHDRCPPGPLSSPGEQSVFLRGRLPGWCP